MSDDLGTISGAIEIDLSSLEGALASTNEALASVEASITKAGSTTDAVAGQMTASMRATADAMQQTQQASLSLAESIGQGEQRYQSLNAAIQLQQRDLSVLNSELVAVVGAYGESSTQAERKRIQIARLNAAIEGNVGRLGDLRAELDQANQNLNESGGAMGALSNIMQGMAQGAGQLLTQMLTNIAQAAMGLAATLVTGNASMEQYQVQFGVMLKSADAAQQRLAELDAYANATPFDLPGVIKADLVLQNFGLHSQETAQRFGMSGTEIRTTVGDIAAGTSASMAEIAGYLGQFGAGQTGDTLSRFEELGIVTRDTLKGMGLEFSKAGELTSPVDEAMTVMLKFIKEKYAGMAAAQAGTFNGMLSNLNEWMSKTTRTIGKPLFDALKVQMDGLGKVLSSPEVLAAIQSIADALAQLASNPAVGAAFTAVSAGVANLIIGLGTLAKNLVPVADYISKYLTLSIITLTGVTIAWAATNSGSAALALALLIQRVIISTSTIWANTTALIANAAAFVVANAGWFVAAAAIAALVYAWQQWQGMMDGSTVLNKLLTDTSTAVGKSYTEAGAALVRYNAASAATKAATKAQADELTKLQAEQKADLDLRGQMDRERKGDQAWWDASNAAINARIRRMNELTGVMNANLTAGEAGTLVTVQQTAAETSAAAATKARTRAFAEMSAEYLVSTGDIDGALAVLRESAGNTAEEMTKLAEATAKAYEEGSKAFSAVVDAEVGFLAERDAAAQEHAATLENIETDRQDAVTKATTAYAKKRADIEEAYAKKQNDIAADYAEKRADTIAKTADKVAELERKKAEQLVADLKEAWAEGTTALGDATDADVQFVQDAEQRRKDHTGKLKEIEQGKTTSLADLDRAYREKLAGIEGTDAAKKRAQAKADYEQKRADLLKASADKTQAEQATFAEGEAQAALAYAKEQAAQSEHLGRMLIQYTMAQGLMQGISKERIEAMTASLADEYGVQTTMTERNFGKMRDVIDQWAQAGGEGTAQYTQQLGGLREEATRSQIALDQLIKDRTAAAQADFTGGRIGMDEYLKRLQAIPKTARTELGLDTTGVQVDTSKVGVGQATIDKEIYKAKQDGNTALLALDADYTKQLQDAAATRAAALSTAEKDYQDKLKNDINQAAKDKAAIEDAAYKASEQKAALAYAKEQAARKAELGRALIDYLRSQADSTGMLDRAPEAVSQMTDRIAAQYGVQQTAAERGWAASAAAIKAFVASGGQDVDLYAGKLQGIQDAATTAQQLVNAKIKTMTEQATTDFNAGRLSIKSYTDKLATIPTEADAAGKALKKLPTTIRLTVTNEPPPPTPKPPPPPTQDATGNFNQSGGPFGGPRASGGPVAGGALYEVAEGGAPELLVAAGRTYLMMGAQGGTVLPAMAQAQAAMAGQGQMARAVATLGGAPALPARVGGTTVNLTVAPVFNGAILDTAERMRQMAQQIVGAARTALQGDLSTAVDTLILAGGTR